MQAILVGERQQLRDLLVVPVAQDEIDDGDEIRSESGLRLLLGGGLDWRAHDRFGVRAGFRYGSGGSDDADTHWGPVVGAHFNF